MTFSAVGGLSINCVKLVGITALMVDVQGVILAPLSSSKGEEELLLVMEKASEGSLLDFVGRHLIGKSEAESWNFIVETLHSIAHGICNLHNHGIIHG
jgi:serine/threonine protein kinase